LFPARETFAGKTVRVVARKACQSSPNTCRVSGAQDQRCKSFTFVGPGVTEPSGECHLKSAVPPLVPSPGMTSGVKQGLEMNTDRSGGDFSDFNISPGVPEVCQAACARDSRCQSFTFAPPGYVGSSAHCWLKSSVPPASTNEALVSGISGTDFF
jgi:hypothetical protein